MTPIRWLCVFGMIVWAYVEPLLRITNWWHERKYKQLVRAREKLLAELKEQDRELDRIRVLRLSMMLHRPRSHGAHDRPS